MRINPGGALPLDQIIGRTHEIARYWRVLARQSLVLDAERRIGKTHLVRKMQASPPENMLVLYQDLERCHSIIEFIKSLYHAVSEHLPKAGRLKTVALS